MLRSLSRTAVCIAALAGATCLTVPAFAQEPKTISGGFDVGPGGFPGHFNPLTATAGFTWLSIYLEPLVIYNEDMSAIIGDLASDWTASEDQKQITFTLAEAKWHDGEDFTSADVKFTIELAKNPESGSIFAGRLDSVESVEAPDDRTIVLNLTGPSPSLLATLTQLLMLPEHAVGDIPVNELADSTWWSTSPIGTGPFKFETHVADQYVELSANTDFRGGAPKVDRLINRYFQDSAASLAALRAGDIQFTYVEAADAATVESDTNLTLIEGSSAVANYIGFNGELDLWNDVRVRQAFMYGIDRASVVSQIYQGAATVASCGYTAANLVPGDIETYDYDPDKARALLEEAGWAELNGDQPITWLTYYSDPTTANVMAAVQAMMAQVGVNLVPRTVDPPTYNGIVNAPEPNFADYPLVYAGIRNGPDPSSINVAFNQSQIPPNGNNFLRIRDEGVSTALDSAMSAADPGAAEAGYQDVCRAMSETVPVATMWVASRYGAASTKLENFIWLPAPAGGPFESHPEAWDIAE